MWTHPSISQQAKAGKQTPSLAHLLTHMHKPGAGTVFLETSVKTSPHTRHYPLPMVCPRLNPTSSAIYSPSLCSSDSHSTPHTPNKEPQPLPSKSLTRRTPSVHINKWILHPRWKWIPDPQEGHETFSTSVAPRKDRLAPSSCPRGGSFSPLMQEEGPPPLQEDKLCPREPSSE